MKLFTLKRAGLLLLGLAILAAFALSQDKTDLFREKMDYRRLAPGMTPDQNQNLWGFRTIQKKDGNPGVQGATVGSEIWHIAFLNASFYYDWQDINLPLTKGNRFTVKPVLMEGEKLHTATFAFSANFGAIFANNTVVTAMDEAGGKVLARVHLKPSGVQLGFMDQKTPLFYGDGGPPLNTATELVMPWMSEIQNYSFSYVFQLKLEEPGNIILEVTKDSNRGAVQTAVGGFSELRPRP